MNEPRAADPRPQTLAEDLVATMAAIRSRGWCDATGGNFSCVLSPDPLRLLMAPSGVEKGSVRPEDLIVVDRGGAVMEGEGRASAETLLHLQIVRSCGAGAVLHTHSQAATLLSRLALSRRRSPVQEQAAQLSFEGLEMLKGLEGINSHDTKISLTVLANDQDLGRLSEAASAHLPSAPHGLLIGGHGLYAWGADLFSARRHLEVLEFLLEQQWRSLLVERWTLGNEPQASAQAHG